MASVYLGNNRSEDHTGICGILAGWLSFFEGEAIEDAQDQGQDGKEFAYRCYRVWIPGFPR